LSASFRPDQNFGVVAGEGNGFVFTFLLTLSSLFWCAGQYLQVLNIAEHKLALHLPALESRAPDFEEKPRNRDICSETAAFL